MKGTKDPQRLYLIKSSQLDHVAHLLAESFFDDPFFVYVLPDEQERRMVAKKVYRRIAKHYISLGAAYATSANLEGVVLINDASHHHAIKEFFMKLAFYASFIPLLPKIHLRSAVRKMTSISKFDKFIAHNIRRFPSRLEIAFLCVDPNYRGQGHMKTLLTSLFEYAHDHQMTCVLETEKLDNVARYEHYGMHQVATIPTHQQSLNYYILAKTY